MYVCKSDKEFEWLDVLWFNFTKIIDKFSMREYQNSIPYVDVESYQNLSRFIKKNMISCYQKIYDLLYILIYIDIDLQTIFLL